MNHFIIILPSTSRSSRWSELRKNNWILTLREGHRLRVFESRVLREICGPKKDEVTGEWRRMHSEELNDLY